MRFSWQNLNRDKNDRIKGGGWKHGRAWLRVRERETDVTYDSITFCAEWNVPGSGVALTLETGYGDTDNGVQLHIKTPLVQVFLSMEGVQRLRTAGRIFGFYTHARGLWVHRGGSPWDGNVWHFDPADTFLGRPDYREETLSEHEGTIDFDGEKYPVTIRLTRATWKRPRWHWPLCVYRAHIDVKAKSGIPIPGNFDSDFYDGDDAIFSMTCLAKTVDEAAQAIIRSARETRLRRGGLDWAPKEEVSP